MDIELLREKLRSITCLIAEIQAMLPEDPPTRPRLIVVKNGDYDIDNELLDMETPSRAREGVSVFDEEHSGNVFGARNRQTIRFPNIQGSALGECKTQNSLFEEVKAMLVTLNIKGSLRMRRGGLLEFRSVQFGSVYGRSEEDIRKGIDNKMRLLRSHQLPKRKKNKVPLLSEFFEKNYFPYKQRQDRAEKTLTRIRYNYNFIIQSGFDRRLNEYTPAMLEEFLYSVPQTRKRQILKGLFNNIFHRALALSVITTNPCAPLDAVKHDVQEGSALSFAEQEEFFEALFAIDMPPLQKLYLIFVFLTGARRDEAIAVTWNDVNQKEKILRLPGTKTRGSDRLIPLYPLVEKIFAVFESPRRGKIFDLNSAVADRAFRKVTGKHKLHDLRHTFGTMQICVEKLDIKSTSLLMGHATVHTTLKIYTHPEALDRSLFLRGDLSEAEKVAILRERRDKIYRSIEEFLECVPKIYPKIR